MILTGNLGKKINKVKKCLLFAKYCFRKGDDDRFVNAVKQIGKEFELVRMERGANPENQKDVIYHIKMEPSGSGFFADYNKLLEYLYFADHFNLTPVVEFSSESMYAEDEEINGSSNPFEYYFEQPEGIGVKDLDKQDAYVRSRKENIILSHTLNKDNGGYAKTEKYLTEMSRMVQKYIRLNSATEFSMKKDICGVLGYKKVLGVHVRGTDFKQNYNGHPIAVTAQEYLKETQELWQTKKYERVFLATDDSNALELFKASFADDLVYYSDVIRSGDNISVMNSKVERKHHHFLLGYEVLRDMMTLAECDGLVAGLSQVSYAARIHRLSSGTQYEDMMILDKGINYHRRNNCPVEERRK